MRAIERPSKLYADFFMVGASRSDAKCSIVQLNAATAALSYAIQYSHHSSPKLMASTTTPRRVQISTLGPLPIRPPGSRTYRSLPIRT